MSYSISQSGEASELKAQLEESFAAYYLNPAPGTKEQVERSAAFVGEHLSGLKGRFQATLTGHVNQGENDPQRTSLSISVQPTT